MNRYPLTKKNIIRIFKKQKKFFLNREKLNLEFCNGRILSENIKSKINLPPFNNSAVDGFAILKEDLKLGAKLLCKRRITAGDNKKIKIFKGEAIRIFTGARMPTNSFTVLMQENASYHENTVIIKKVPKLGENHRLKGEDISKNKVILKKGTRLNSTNINLIAAIGISKVSVFKKLKVTYFTSGNELKKPTIHLKGSQINNSNYYALNNLLHLNFIKKKYSGNLKDNFKKIEDKIIKNSKKNNLIITTGGASVGEEDHLIKVIEKVGKILFWKAAIKPGRPLALGKINNCYIICLPGNPVSVQLLFSLLVKPFLYYLSGGDFFLPKPEKIKVNFNMIKKTKRMEWLRVIKNKNNLEFVAEKYKKQGSGMISSIAYSDGIIEVEENVSKIMKGDIFDYYDFQTLFN